MKRFITLLASLLFFASFYGFADGPHQFQKDENGEYFLDGDFDIPCNQGIAWKRLVNYVESYYNTDRAIINVNDDAMEISVKGGKELISNLVNDSFNYRNKSYVHYNLQLRLDNNKVFYVFNNLIDEVSAQLSSIDDIEKKESFKILFRDYEKDLKIINDPKSSKREIKAAKKDLQRFEPFLEVTQKALLNRIESIKLSLE